MSKQINELIQDKNNLKGQLKKLEEGAGSFTEKQRNFHKQIDDLIAEKKVLKEENYNLKKDTEQLKQQLTEAKLKFDSNYVRFESSINRLAELEKDYKEQEETLLKRHRDLQKTISENNFLKGELDTITKKYGSLDEIKFKMTVAEEKEKRINKLLDSIELTQKSTENQLSCYHCLNLMNDPVILSPCGHALCRSCLKKTENKCP